MEQKLNIAEILKNKPQGTKLYDLLRNIEVELDSISHTDYENSIWCRYNDIDPYDLYEYSTFGTERGWLNGLQILLPSKEMRDWEKFAWKKGDVLAGAFGALCIFDKWANDDYTRFDAKFVTPKSRGTTFEVEDWCKITNEACIRQYIRDIEEDNGGKLNLTTLEIENNQPEFKDGDIVCISGMGYLAYGIVKSIDNSSKKLEYYALNDMSTLKTDDWLSFEDKQIQSITETQQIILFDALAKEGKAWDAEKKQIVDLKPKVEFKPFDKVLVRHQKTEEWSANIFSHTDKTDEYLDYVCVNSRWEFCIPYEGNELLLGTTKDVED